MLHQIGVGALGPVFRTYEPARDRLVAVKVFRLDITPEQAQALADELARAADAGLFHPSIVEPIAAGVQGTVAYRAEEYVPAESLDVAMRHFAPAPPDTVLPFITQLAGALDFARASGVGHGALHPRDIFVTPEEARVTGFGVVEALERVGLRAPVRRPYSPPERIAGEPWGTPADVFSLAAIAFEMLTGRRPAGTGPGLGEIKEDSAGPHPARLVAVLARAMSDRPEDRYPNALAFAAALEAAGRGEGEIAAAAVPAPAAGSADEGGQAPAPGESPGELDAVSQVAEPEAPAPPIRLVETGETAAADAAFADEGPLPGPATPAAEPRAASQERRAPSPEPRAPKPEMDDRTAERRENEAHPVRAREEQDARLHAGDAAHGPDGPGDRLETAADRFMLGAADLVLDDASREPAFANEFEARADSAAHAEPTPRARAAKDDSAAAEPPRRLHDSHPYDRPLAEEATGDSRVMVVHSRAAMLPLAMALILGLPLAFAAGYVVRGRTAVPGDAGTARPVEQAAAADAGSSPAGTTYSEQAIDQAPAPVPPPAAPDVPAEPAGGGSASPPPADPGPTTGRLVVRSTPANAAVTVNGRWSGRTPLTLTDLAFGDYVVRVVADGYRVGRETFTLDAGNASRTIAVRLDREPAASGRAAPAPPRATPPSERSTPAAYYGSVFVDSRPQGATVYLGGKPRGKTPLRIPQVPIGSHVVRLELVDHSAWTKVVRVTAGQEARATGSLDPIR